MKKHSGDIMSISFIVVVKEYWGGETSLCLLYVHTHQREILGQSIKCER